MFSNAVGRYFRSKLTSEATETQKEAGQLTIPTFVVVCTGADGMLPYQERDGSGGQDSATLNPTRIPTKRSASPLHTEDTTPRKKTRAKICDEEKRLREHHSPNPHATPIPLPANEWKVGSSPMSNTQSRRKPGAGGIKPRNTLGTKSFQSKSTSTPRTLETATTTGDNVQGGYTSSPHFHQEHPPKRRKIDTPSPSKVRSDDGVEVVIIKPNVDFWNREPLPQLPRKLSSTVTSDSQGSARTTHRPEMDTLVGRQKKPRKANPKLIMDTSSSQMSNDKEVVEVFDSQPSQTMYPPQVVPIAHSSRHNAIVVGDDDNAEHVRKRPASSQTASAKTPRAPTIQVPSAFDALQEEDGIRYAKQTVASKISSTSPPTVRAPSPSLQNKFVRDSPHTRPSILKSMLPSSSVSKTAIAEGSEDELAPDYIPRGTQCTAKNKPLRPLSPSDIKSTTFTSTTPAKPRRRGTVQNSDQKGNDKLYETFKLAAFYTLSFEDSSSDDLTLAFSLKDKSFFIQKAGVPALVSSGESPFLFSSNHAQKICATQKPPFRLGIEGSTHAVTGGHVWFDFTKHKDLTRCLELLNGITPDRVKAIILEPDQFGKRFNTSMKVFDNLRTKQSIYKDPELQAMEHRRESRVPTTQSRAMAARERQKSAQKGENPPWEEPRGVLNTAPVSLKDRMKGGSTVPHRHSEPRSSPVIEPSPNLQGRTTRTSRRLQDKDDAPVHVEPRMKRWTREHEPPEWDSPLVYPSTGPKRTTVEAQDIERLDDGEFLNDSLISFCLRHLEENNPGLKDKVHIFNTFFYTSLSTKQGRRGFNYDAVKRWTKNIDIFTYPFVVVPVNVNLHWFVTIICNLDKLDRKLEDEDDSDENEIGTGSGSEDSSMIDNQVGEDNVPGSLLRSELPDSQEEQSAEVVREEVGRLSISDSGNLHQSDNDQDDENVITYESETPAPAPVSSTARKAPVRKAKRLPPPLPKLDSKQPTIITLDSLGASHSTEVRNLKNYIVQEGREKRGMTIEFSEIKGMLAKGIPEQTNFCDCGVYLVGYITEFLKNPSEFVRKVLSRELDKKNDFAGFDPSEKRAEIRNQLVNLEKVQSEARRKQKKAQNEAKKQKVREATLRQVDGAVDDAESSKSRATTPAARGSESGRQSKEVASSPAAASVTSDKTSVTEDANKSDAGTGAGAEFVADSFLNGIHEAAHSWVD